MHQFFDRSHRMKHSLLVASILFSAVAGCDQLENQSSRADRKVGEAVAKGTVELAGVGAGTGAAARTAIKEAASEADASASSKAAAKSLLADADLRSAQEVLDDVAKKRVELASSAWRMQQLTEQLKTAAVLAKMYKELDPAANREQVANVKRGAQGSATETAWFQHEGADVPTLSAVTQDISRMQGEITRRQQQIDELKRQQSDLQQQASQATTHADELKGDAAVSEFRRGTELRKQAAALESQIQTIEYELSPLKNDLSVAQIQSKTLEQAVANFDRSGQDMDQSWQAVQQQINSQNELMQALLNGGSDANPNVAVSSIAGEAARYNQILAASQEARMRAEGFLSDAIASSGEAATAAEKLRSEMQQQATNYPASKGAFDSLASTHNVGQYRLQQATAKHLLATSKLAAVADLNAKQQLIARLNPVLQENGLKLPAELSSAEVESQMQLAREEAAAAFADADASLANVLAGGLAPQSVRSSARAMRILTLHAWSEFDRLAGMPEQAEEHLTLARQETAQAVQDKVALPPSLPAELRSAAVPAPAAPATEPATPAAPAGTPAM